MYIETLAYWRENKWEKAAKVSIIVSNYYLRKLSANVHTETYLLYIDCIDREPE